MQNSHSDFTVRDLMTAPVVTLDADEDLGVADTVMQLKRIRHLPVLQAGKLVGLVTHRDILRAQVSSTAGLSPREAVVLERRVKASNVMATDVQTTTPDTPILEAARTMRQKQLGCLPVVAEGQLVGIITEADFLDLTVRILENLPSG